MAAYATRLAIAKARRAGLRMAADLGRACQGHTGRRPAAVRRRLLGTAPSAVATELFGDQVMPLAGLLEPCRSAGWRVIHMSVADQREWADFESTFRAGRQEWLLAHAADRAPLTYGTG
jgi:hypothetical protein